MCMRNFIRILHSVQESFTFSEFGARPMIIVILQSLGLDIVNTCINVYAKVYQTIPNGLRVMDNFHCFRIWSSAKPHRNDKCHFSIFWARSCQYQCVCENCSKYFKRFKSYGHFSLSDFHFLTGDKIFPNCPVTKSNV